MTIEIVLDHRAIIGESPTWVAKDKRLFWIDVKAPALHCFWPRGGETRTWPLTSDVGGFALMNNDAALVALRHGLYRLDLNTGALGQIAPSPFDPALFRFNRGRVRCEWALLGWRHVRPARRFTARAARISS